MGNSKLRNLLTSLAVVAAVFFCSASVSAETFEVDGIFYNVLNNSEVEVTQAPDPFYYVHDVVIPERVTHEGKTYSVTAVGDEAFSNCQCLTSIKMGNNITEFGESAFERCAELTSMKFPQSLKKIDNNALSGCYKLYDIQFSGNVEFIGEYSFGSIVYNSMIPWFKNQPDGPVYVDKVFLGYKGDCPETVSIKEGTVCIAGQAFDSRVNLKTVNLPSSLKFIVSNAFVSAQNLANLNFANVENLEYVGKGAFSETSWLKNLPKGPVYLGKVFFRYNDFLPENYTIKNGTVMIADDAFRQYSTDFNLKSVSIPNSVKIIGEKAFELCGSIKSIVLPEGLKNLNAFVFQDCYDLESVKLPSTLETLNSSAFAGCYTLKQIDLPANLREFTGSDFRNSASLVKFTVDKGNANFCTDDGILFSKDKKVLVAFPESREGDYRVPSFVEKIMDGAFIHCKLKSVTIPASVSEIGSSIFRYAELLESVTFEPGSKVKILPQSSFEYCFNLKNVVLPDSLEEVYGQVFDYCPVLENIQFPETLKFMDLWGNDKFKWYENQPDGIVYAGKLAFNIKGDVTTATLTVKEGTKTINSDFGSWLEITELVLPESLELIRKGAFSRCENLAVVKGGSNAITEPNVFLDSKWTDILSSDPAFNGVCVLGKNVFNFDNAFKNVVINEGIENLSLPYRDYPRQMRKISKLELPESLKYIQKNSFRDNVVTDTLIVKNIVPLDITKAEISFSMFENCVLRVPEELVDTYRNARGWSLFRKINNSGVETVEIDNIRVFADGENIVIEGVEEGTPVEVFNLNGQTVYRGVETLINVADKGIYLVRVDGKAYKVAM